MATELLGELSRLGIELWAEEGKLRYRAPKGALTPEIRDRISGCRQELLEALPAVARATAPDLPPLDPAPEARFEPFPLTDMQQAYWIGRGAGLELGDIGPKSYLELDCEELDLARFEQAWRRVVERHDMLRAVVLPEGLQQVLERVPPYQIRVLDLRHLPAEERESALREVRQEMLDAIYPPDRWPLFEVRASLLSEGRLRLHIGRDLMIGDARSSQVLVQDLFRFYWQPEAVLSPLEISYRDYILALRRLEDHPVYREARDHWARRLPALPPPPELPRAGGQLSGRHRLEQREGELDAETWSRLKARAARVGVTPSALLCAAFAEVLAAWSRLRSFTLNLLFSNRLPLHPRVHDLVGNFATTLLLAVETSGDDFESRARRLQERLWEDMPHHLHNGVRVLRDLHRARGWQGQVTMPIVFSSALGLTEGAAPPAEDSPALPGRVELVFSSLQTPQVLLEVLVTEARGNLWFAWNSVQGAFPEGLVESLFGAYERLLHRLSREEEAWTDPRLSLLPPDQLERRAAVNATAAPVPRERLHEGFLGQARLRPDRPAILDPRRTLTYGELRNRSGVLANLLISEEVRPNELVAVVLEKGWEQAVATLGILRSGAAYLPLDPRLPRERLWYLLDRAQARIAVTGEGLLDRVEWPEGIRRISVDRLGEEEEAGPDEETPRQAETDLAYVIFTSGSTGFPKGVMIDHRGAVNTLADVNRRFSVGPDDRVLALSSLSFDLSVWDLFGILAAGGTVVIPEPAHNPDPEGWLQLLAEHRVTIWNSVPALMELVAESAARAGERLPPSLRLVLMSGDWIPVGLPDRLRALSDGLEVISMGGATEASIWSILYPIGEVDPAWRSIPYGRAMVNQTFHVLDGRLEPCPDWVPGDLHIGGIGLAQGYWRDEAKTRASFFRHPRTGERLYRTGDLGRWLPDGHIEFLGREDFQVKIQGYRIELGEIEVALSQHPAVREAVVTAAGEAGGKKRLVAYVVSERSSGEPMSVHDLRVFLAGKLPEYMVPPVFVFLEALPLTANGKVDRQALPAPDGARPELGADFRASRTPAEESLVRIWEDMLQVHPVGVEDDFFELGGDSLLAVQLMAAIERTCGRRLGLAALFEHATIAGLAPLLAEEEKETAP